jgi:hypothetical protein
LLAEGRARGIAQRHVESFAAFEVSILVDQDGNGLARFAGCEGDGARSVLEIVALRLQQIVGRRIGQALSRVKGDKSVAVPQLKTDSIKSGHQRKNRRDSNAEPRRRIDF